MAQQVLSGSDLQRMLNEEVDPVLREEINLRTMAMRVFKLKTVPVSGKYYRIVLKYGGNFYGTGSGELDSLPGMDANTAYQDKRSKVKTLQLLFYRRFFRTTVDMSGPVRSAPQTDSGGFGPLGKQIMDDTVENLKEMISLRFAAGQMAPYGEVGTAVGGVAANVVTLNPASSNIPWGGNRLIREGQVFSITNGATFTNALRTALTKDQGRLLDSMGEDTATPTLTFNDLGTQGVDNLWGGAGGNTTADKLFMLKSRSTSAITSSASDWSTLVNQPMGIMDAVNASTDSQYAVPYYGDQLRSSNRVLESVRVHNSGTLRVVSLDDINLAFERVEVDSVGGDAPNLIYTTPSVRRKIAGFLTATTGSTLTQSNPVRINDPGRSNVNLGIPGIEITTLGSKGSMMLNADPLAPHHRVYLVNTKTMMILQDKQPGFMDDDGLTLRNENGFDSFYVAWKWYNTGLINFHPRKSAYIVDATGDHLS